MSPLKNLLPVRFLCSRQKDNLVAKIEKGASLTLIRNFDTASSVIVWVPLVSICVSLHTHRWDFGFK